MIVFDAPTPALYNVRGWTTQEAIVQLSIFSNLLNERRTATQPNAMRTILFMASRHRGH